LRLSLSGSGAGAAASTFRLRAAVLKADETANPIELATKLRRVKSWFAIVGSS
jgi:hypothetical protein